MSLLGKSSLLNAGAIPLAMGGTAVSMVTDGVGSAVRGGAGLLEHLAMDEAKKNRRLFGVCWCEKLSNTFGLKNRSEISDMEDR